MPRTNFYTTEAGIASQIGNLPLGTGRVALVGGHYLLLYERKSDSLKPAIYQDFNDLGNKIFSKKLGQNFPVKSFELSVQLYLQFRRSGVACKNVLLVNDDSFLRKDFRTEEHYELIKDRGFELRRNYFASNENIPDIYKSILRKFSLSTADFFSDFVNEQAGEDNLLPERSVFVSERRR